MWSAWSLSSRHFRNSRRRLPLGRHPATDPQRADLEADAYGAHLVVAVAAGIAFASLAAIGLSTATVASATTSGPPAVAQCNPPDFPITGPPTR